MTIWVETLGKATYCKKYSQLNFTLILWAIYLSMLLHYFFYCSTQILEKFGCQPRKFLLKRIRISWNTTMLEFKTSSLFSEDFIMTRRIPAPLFLLLERPKSSRINPCSVHKTQTGDVLGMPHDHGVQSWLISLPHKMQIQSFFRSTQAPNTKFIEALT